MSWLAGLTNRWRAIWDKDRRASTIEGCVRGAAMEALEKAAHTVANSSVLMSLKKRGELVDQILALRNLP